MRIVVVSSYAKSLVNFRGPLLEEMRSRGNDVCALAPDFDNETRTALSNMGVTCVEFSLSRSGVNPARELAVVFELRRIIRELRPDVVFSYYLKPVFYGAIAAWLAGIQRRFGLIEGLGFAFTESTGTSLRRLALQRVISLVAKLALARLHKVIFLNSDDLNEFVSRRLVSREKTALLGAIGLDLDEWQASPLPREPGTFIMVARLLRDKGVYEYVSAARLLKPDYPEATFHLLGGIDENPAAISQEELDSWVHEGLIEWPGHVPVEPFLKASSVFVLPSYREGVPRSTQEAMAIGRAVVTTDVPGCRETVVKGRNGFLVPPRDPKALASAMQHFLDNPDDAALMGAESRKIAEERFDVHVQNRALLEIMGL